MFTVSPITTRLFLSALVVFVVALGGSLGIWFSLEGRGADFAGQLQVATNVAAQEEAIQTLYAIVADTEIDRLAIESYFLDVVQIAQLLEMIEQYAAEQDLQLESVQLQQLGTNNAEADGISQVRIPYRVSGTHEAVLGFVELLEAIPYHGYMEQLTITRPAHDQVQAEARVTIVVSYRQYD